ncbi:hypothetical protein QAD02_021133 [Eretmocerus hayati]|uniref:Uncharacterized protein n=1 Tax=Eretmocerus hayati TaxID=131215 RepID=A0ACC2PPK4_9HYME|nr:hypothetical protein QAD02_021133 [Eretmocerus hayati]
MKFDGNLAGAALLMEISEPTHAAEIKATIEKKPAIRRSVARSVALLIDLNLSKEQYKQLRRKSREDGDDWLVSYDQISKGKKETYPDEIRVTETSAEVGLQDLVYSTTKRLLQYLVEEGLISPSDAENILRFILLFKWGFDGTNVTEYNQRSIDPDYDFSHVLCTYMVPLRLVDKVTGKIIWQNPTPNSTRMCRPIRLQYLEETDENILKEADDIQSQIDELQPLELGFCHVEFKFILRMVDGKANSSICI